MTLLYDTAEIQDSLLLFLEAMKERVLSGEVVGIVGFTTEMREGDWGVCPFSMGRYDHKDVIYGLEETKHSLLHGELD